eukprot:4337632-Prymnesium_polylepis.1
MSNVQLSETDHTSEHESRCEGAQARREDTTRGLGGVISAKASWRNMARARGGGCLSTALAVGCHRPIAHSSRDHSISHHADYRHEDTFDGLTPCLALTLFRGDLRFEDVVQP